MGNEKSYPKVGDRLYLSQRTGNGMIDMVRHPYTVIGVNTNCIFIQECNLIFNGPRYYDTLADDIVEDKNGRIKQLFWKPKFGCWGTRGRETDYPEYATFGRWDYQPYLD